MGCHPSLLPFDNLRRVTLDLSLDEEYKKNKTISLLENPNGLLFYRDTSNTVHWFFACQKTEQIIPVNYEAICSYTEQMEYDALVRKMDAMPFMSARRSSDDEHALISKVLHYYAQSGESYPVILERNGIQYIRGAVSYHDTQHDFNRLINAYRTCIECLEKNEAPEVADTLWTRQMGRLQTEVLWLLKAFSDTGLPSNRKAEQVINADSPTKKRIVKQ